MLANQLAHLDHIILTAHQRVALQRQVVAHRLERTQHRERTGSTWNKRSLAVRSFNRCSPKIHQPNVTDQTGS